MHWYLKLGYKMAGLTKKNILRLFVTKRQLSGHNNFFPTYLYSKFINRHTLLSACVQLPISQVRQ